MLTQSGPVFFVDDDVHLREVNAQSLELAGLAVRTFASAEDALAELDAQFAGVVVTDVRMPRVDGMQFFSRLRSIDSAIPVILISGHADLSVAVAALKAGAHDFLAKPYAADHLVASVRRALSHRELELDNRRLKALALSAVGAGPSLLGDSNAMVRLREAIEQVASAEVDVLVEGETGSGKSLVAQLLHRQSHRRGRPFVTVHCGAMPDTAAEAHLFGQVPGAGGRTPPGRIVAADRGTLFLDGIEALSPRLQIKLMEVIEEGEVLAIGAKQPQPVQVRIIASASRALRDLVGQGLFRADLFYRLSVVRLNVPPLRDRRADIALLYAHFVGEATRRSKTPAAPLSYADRRHLAEHDWPGNVRELKNFAFRSALGFTEDGTAAQTPASASATLPERMESFEAEIIAEVLSDCRGDVRTALDRLGIPRKTFYDKLVRHRIDIKAFRAAPVRAPATEGG